MVTTDLSWTLDSPRVTVKMVGLQNCQLFNYFQKKKKKKTFSFLSFFSCGHGCVPVWSAPLVAVTFILPCSVAEREDDDSHDKGINDNADDISEKQKSLEILSQVLGKSSINHPKTSKIFRFFSALFQRHQKKISSGLLVSQLR